MEYNSLAEFVQVLQREGELSRIAYPVKPEPEITEITDRVMQSGRPTLLFENVVDKQIPVCLADGVLERSAVRDPQRVKER
jgi:4-hydroxy-3-polyprenylbenzoate decarboxylase